MQELNKLSVVVACYRDAGSVNEMHRRLTEALPGCCDDWEIIFVNDASPDDAEEIIREVIERDSKVKLVCHSRNFGSQMAFTSGIDKASGDAVVCMDGDLQDPPEVIPDLVAKWREGFDVVYGVRAKRQDSLGRRLGYKIFYRLFRTLSYLDIPLDAGDFGIMSIHVARVIAQMPERDRFNRGLRAYAGFRQTGLPYTREARYAGETTNSLFNNVEWALKGIFSFSFVPLRFISYLSVVMLFISFVLILIYVLLYFLKPDAPRGFLTLFVIISFFGSIQLFCNAVIAEYIGRIFQEVKRRPRYIVRDYVDREAGGEPQASTESATDTRQGA